MYEEHNDYIDINEWRKRTRESRISLETEMRTIEERLAVVTEEYNRVKEEEELIAQAVRAYQARLQTSSKPFSLKGDSLREILIIHFADPAGIIIGKQASVALLDYKYFSDRRAADGAIYTALSKPPFEKVDKGIYHIHTDSDDWRRLRGNGQRSNGNDSTPLTEAYQPTLESVQTEKSLRQRQIAAVVQAARQSRGYIRTGKTKSVLSRAGLFNNPKTVGLVASSVLGQSGRFEKIERGLYRLLE